MKQSDFVIICFINALVIAITLMNYESMNRIENKLDKIIDFENLNEITAE